MEIHLTSAEVKLIDNKINWSFNVPFDRSPQPTYTSSESQELGTVLDSLISIAAIRSTGASISGNQIRSASETISTDEKVVQQVIRCIRLFSSKVGHSPMEVAAVTGLPSTLLEALLERISSIECVQSTVT